MTEKEDDDEIFDLDDEERENIDDTPNHTILETEVHKLLNEIENIVKEDKLSPTNRFDKNVTSRQETFAPFKKAKVTSTSHFQDEQAQLLLEMIRRSCPYALDPKFKYFDIYMILPIFKSLGNI